MRKDNPLSHLQSIRPSDIGNLPVWVAHQQLQGNVLSGWLGRDVQTLNIDSASFTQIEEQAGGDKAKIAEIMLGIVEKQGKHRNPVTGSGGMLLGTVEKSEML